MITPGTRLGPYEIVATLGVGGMGEVYRARDARLGRDVAIKVLPDQLGGDADRLARFEREAKLLASMNHAGIAAIYGLEDAGGRPALVMEVVEGPTLAERLEHGPLAEDEALDVARQLADALEYAHDHGIVHRDLKPANVKLRPDGVVKVLDFGLARAFQTDVAGTGGDMTTSPTLTGRMTVAGVILGTAAYMSPEQARGRETDRRADIWAYGCVLFEMLTGRRAFEGDTVSDTFAAVMRDDPDWSALPASLPPGVPWLLRRCLVKDPRARLQAIGEARIALGDPSGRSLVGVVATSDHGAGAATSTPPARTRTGLLVAAAALAGLVAGAGGDALLRRPPPTPGATEVSMIVPPGHRLGSDRGYHFFAISPDGRAVAYASASATGSGLLVRRLDARSWTALPGTESARNLFFSPDGEWIGFFNSVAMSKISVHGGAPIVLAEAGQDRSGTWLDDGTIVFAPDVTTGLFRIPAAGGPPVALTTLDTTRSERTHRNPCKLAGGPWVVFTVGTTDNPGGYDDARIDAVNVRTGEQRTILKGARKAIWAPPGYLLVDRSGTLFAMRIDPRDPRPGAELVPVLDDVDGDTSSGAGFFDVAGDGTLAWVQAVGAGDQREIGWFDRDGRWTPTKLPAGPYFTVKLSPDGSRVLACAGPGGGASDVWVGDLATGAMTRLTYGGLSSPAIWLRDGLRMVFPRGDSTGRCSIVERRLDGAGGERVLFSAPWPMLMTGLTPDGTGVLFSDYGQPQGRVRIAGVGAVPNPREIRPDPGNERYEQAGVISPDGRWIAYVSNRTRREEVYVSALGGAGGRWQVSTRGGGGVRWGRDSRELFFFEQGSEMLMRVPLEVRGTELIVGQPTPLFQGPPSPTEPTYRDYDYDRTHDRFLFTRAPGGAGEERELALSLGWTFRLPAKLRERRQSR